MMSCTMLIFSVSSCATKSNASFILSKARGPHLFLEGLFIFFPHSIFYGGEAFFHHRFVAILIVTAFRLFQVFFGGRFLLPLTLYSCLLFFIDQLSKLLCLRSFAGEMLPHPMHVWFFSHHFPHSSPIRLLFHSLPPRHTCQWFFPFACECSLKHI